MATPEEIKKTALAIYNDHYVGTHWTPDELADISGNEGHRDSQSA
jgi:hypothetical protein